jgi:hypothetical protein
VRPTWPSTSAVSGLRLSGSGPLHVPGPANLRATPPAIAGPDTSSPRSRSLVAAQRRAAAAVKGSLLDDGEDRRTVDRREFDALDREGSQIRSYSVEGPPVPKSPTGYGHARRMRRPDFGVVDEAVDHRGDVWFPSGRHCVSAPRAEGIGRGTFSGILGGRQWLLSDRLVRIPHCASRMCRHPLTGHTPALPPRPDPVRQLGWRMVGTGPGLSVDATTFTNWRPCCRSCELRHESGCVSGVSC